MKLARGNFESVECQTSTESRLLPSLLGSCFFQISWLRRRLSSSLYADRIIWSWPQKRTASANLVLENKSLISTTLYTLGRSNLILFKCTLLIKTNGTPLHFSLLNWISPMI